MLANTKANYFIFTGGPGAGKTTVLHALRQLGYCVVDEVARSIIQQQNASGGNATHTGDQQAFCDLMLSASITQFKKHLTTEEPVFFDRGIPGLIGYAALTNLTNTDDLIQASKHYRYNPIVFLFPPWETIYCTDTERQQDFSEAIATCDNLKKAHINTHYRIIEVPCTTVEKRVTFILNRVKQQGVIQGIQQYNQTHNPPPPKKPSYTCCLIRTHDNQWLLQQRPSNWTTHPDCLSAFGGRIKSNETVEEALIRELNEQLGATLTTQELEPTGIISEPISKHQELIYTYYWHDRNNTISDCYQSTAKAYQSIDDILKHPKIIDQVYWILDHYENK